MGTGWRILGLLVLCCGCASEDSLFRGLVSGNLYNDPTDIDRRARFEGYEDRWREHAGEQDVAAGQQVPVNLPAAPDP